jgi:hypothetical protein
MAETDSSHGFWIDAVCPNFKVENNIIIGNGSGTYGVRSNIGSGNILVYNNVVTGFSNAIYRSGHTYTSKNNSVFGNDDDFFGTMTIDYCASDDGDGTNPISVPNWNDQYYNGSYVNDVDFRLKSGSVLIDSGVGPSLDASVPSTDIIGISRSGSTSSLGPFENPAFTRTQVTVVVVG